MHLLWLAWANQRYPQYLYFCAWSVLYGQCWMFNNKLLNNGIIFVLAHLVMASYMYNVALESPSNVHLEVNKWLMGTWAVMAAPHAVWVSQLHSCSHTSHTYWTSNSTKILVSRTKNSQTLPHTWKQRRNARVGWLHVSFWKLMYSWAAMVPQQTHSLAQNPSLSPLTTAQPG